MVDANLQFICPSKLIEFLTKNKQKICLKKAILIDNLIYLYT
jgi:hypothetical protein